MSDIETEQTKLRCEGWRRYGGAFTLGPPRWKQCKNDAEFLLTIEQDGEILKDSPACMECWKEGIEKGIKQISAVPVDISQDITSTQDKDRPLQVVETKFITKKNDARPQKED